MTREDRERSVLVSPEEAMLCTVHVFPTLAYLSQQSVTELKYQVRCDRGEKALKQS